MSKVQVPQNPGSPRSTVLWFLSWSNGGSRPPPFPRHRRDQCPLHSRFCARGGHTVADVEKGTHTSKEPNQTGCHGRKQRENFP